MDYDRLAMPLGEAIFTQRAIRRFKSDAIPIEDVHLLLEAAVKAPNGGNQQLGRFLVVNDRVAIQDFGALYHAAWWAKRRDEGFQDREDLPRRFHPAAGLAEAMKDVSCIVFALALPGGSADSVVPAVQNLMLAARHRHRFGADDVAPLGDGSVPHDVRHPARRQLPLLRAARLSAGQLRSERSQADVSDDVSEPVG